MIGSKITGGLIAAVSLVALGLTAGGSFAGFQYGKHVERAKWTEGVAEAGTRSEAGLAEIDAGAEKVPGVIERETQTIIKTDFAAIRTIAELEGQVIALKKDVEDAKNANTAHACPGPLPDDWRMQHTRLDRLLFGGNETGRPGAFESQPRLAGGPPAE